MPETEIHKIWCRIKCYLLNYKRKMCCHKICHTKKDCTRLMLLLYQIWLFIGREEMLEWNRWKIEVLPQSLAKRYKKVGIMFTRI